MPTPTAGLGAEHRIDDAERSFGETIREALKTLEQSGFTGSFRVAGPDQVECLRCRETSRPGAIRLKEMVRIEGVSDPADEEFVAGVVCPRCATKGTLILAYGTGASPEDAAVLLALKDARSAA